jgi:hypothetical protein
MVPLGVKREREAVVLFAELLLDAASKRACVPGGASGGVSTGAFGGVVPFGGRPGKARTAA